MAPDVDAALRDIIATEGKKSEADVQAYIEHLEKAKRLQRDVWF
jgi:sulfite reductase alpha subunit-like flavoprotein